MSEGIKDRVTLDTEAKKSSKESRVFVPVDYLSTSLALKAVYVHPVGDGVTMTQDEFRAKLQDGSIRRSIITDMQFRVFS